MSAFRQSRVGQWLTPRFPLEMAAASVLTLAAVVVIGDRSAPPKTPVPEASKLVLQAPPRAIPLPTQSDQRTADFIEKFALAHVGPPLPENMLADGEQAKPPRPPERAALPAQAQREKPRPVVVRTVTAKPPQRPADAAPGEAEPKDVAAANPPPKGFRIPLVSDVTDKLPSGRDMLDGVGSVGRRIGSIFGKT
jgi:hypothetical protein